MKYKPQFNIIVSFSISSLQSANMAYDDKDMISDVETMESSHLFEPSVILDEDNEMLGESWAEISGLAEIGVSAAPLVDALEEDLSQYLGRAGRKTKADDDALEKELKRIARQTCAAEIGKKPEVTVIVSRLM